MRRNNKWICLGIMLAVAIGLASCDRKTIYYHYEHAPVEGWEKGDVLSFEVPPVSEGTYREEVGLRIDKSYPFLGLCLVIKQTILPSGYVHLDTLNCNLIDQDGKDQCHDHYDGADHHQQTSASLSQRPVHTLYPVIGL